MKGKPSSILVNDRMLGMFSLTGALNVFAGIASHLSSPGFEQIGNRFGSRRDKSILRIDSIINDWRFVSYIYKHENH
jgi:hypothetical protein